LDIGGQATDRHSVTDICRYDMQGEQVAERVHRHMDL
jgi:hypothetical protein